MTRPRSLWPAITVLLVLGPALPFAPAFASHAPDRTVTLYVHGFQPTGVEEPGAYGAFFQDALVDEIASMAGLPTFSQLGGPLRPNAVGAVRYYGSDPPPYYSSGDVADVESMTAQWGGGVPRYALIVAKAARHALEVSGAEQVNFVSASFGSLIVRWLIEKNVEGLAGQGKIARWMTIEGVLCGNWAASRNALVEVWESLATPPIDIHHMSYDWIETNLHAPRTAADSPNYAGILIAQTGSTDDRLNDRALTGVMLAYGEYQPNDGIQALGDARFSDVSAASRFQGRLPMSTTFHVDHYGIADHPGAWAEVATFVSQRRRITITMTSARVDALHEPQLPFWNWTPAEVVFESEVRSPRVLSRWGIDAPLSQIGKDGASAPLRRYGHDGETQQFTHVLFDDLVLEDETELRLDLRAEEVDFDARYGVWETAQQPYTDDLGAGSILVSTRQAGTYSFDAAYWHCTLAVSVFEYPFALPTEASMLPPQIPSGALRAVPEPFTSQVWVTVPQVTSAIGTQPLGAAANGRELERSLASSDLATLRIFDVSGKLVRQILGDPRDGFVWDGLDQTAHAVPSGVYIYRMTAPTGAPLHGKSHRIR